MSEVQVCVQEAASWRLDEIYRYTRDRWGTQQADRYITGLFEAFDAEYTHKLQPHAPAWCFGDPQGGGHVAGHGAA
ncbi:type II toxin-antitoxin system RelE/ParE family toxin [Cognatazoarcus halotolerans]|uniref:type II toxin-antitoxin system RelE/ParE family toxin n=1 Tax=Cognatazoarcus halotolerans TaxID=2686016 RepID=UPI001F3D7BBF|nr:type II toxin-antitoxin system RelE/ParE family toxin [Cognatazoarcus halotolerans]